MEHFIQWYDKIDNGRILFVHINKKNQYRFNHWKKEEYDNDGNEIFERSNDIYRKFKLTLIY